MADKNIKICGINFDIEEIENEKFDDTMGQTSIKDCVIQINDGMKDEMKAQTFLHEWTHAVLDCHGLDNECKNEPLVNAIAIELYNAGVRLGGYN